MLTEFQPDSVPFWTRSSSMFKVLKAVPVKRPAAQHGIAWRRPCPAMGGQFLVAELRLGAWAQGASDVVCATNLRRRVDDPDGDPNMAVLAGCYTLRRAFATRESEENR